MRRILIVFILAVYLLFPGHVHCDSISLPSSELYEFTPLADFGPNGMVVVAGSSNLYLVDTGRGSWTKIQSLSSPASPPVAGNDGKCYVVGRNCSLYELNIRDPKAPSFVRLLEGDGICRARLAISNRDRLIFIPAEDGILAVSLASHSVTYKVTVKNPGPPVVAEDGSLIFYAGNRLYLIQGGVLKGQMDLPDVPVGQPALRKNGNIVLAFRDGTVQEISRAAQTFRLVREWQVSGRLFTGVVIGDEVYVCGEHSLYILKKDGQVVDVLLDGADIFVHPPIFLGNGTLAAVSRNGYLFLIKNGEVRREYLGGFAYTGPTVDPETESLYVVLADGELYIYPLNFMPRVYKYPWPQEGQYPGGSAGAWPKLCVDKEVLDWMAGPGISPHVNKLILWNCGHGGVVSWQARLEGVSGRIDPDHGTLSYSQPLSGRTIKIEPAAVQNEGLFSGSLVIKSSGKELRVKLRMDVEPMLDVSEKNLEFVYNCNGPTKNDLVVSALETCTVSVATPSWLDASPSRFEIQAGEQKTVTFKVNQFIMTEQTDTISLISTNDSKGAICRIPVKVTNNCPRPWNEIVVSDGPVGPGSTLFDAGDKIGILDCKGKRLWLLKDAEKYEVPLKKYHCSQKKDVFAERFGPLASLLPVYDPLRNLFFVPDTEYKIHLINATSDDSKIFYVGDLAVAGAVDQHGHLLIATPEGKFIVFDREGHLVFDWKEPLAWFNAAPLRYELPGGHVVWLIGSRDGIVRAFGMTSAGNWKMLGQWQGTAGISTSLAIAHSSGGGKYLAVPGMDGVIHLLRPYLSDIHSEHGHVAFFEAAGCSTGSPILTPLMAEGNNLFSGLFSGEMVDISLETKENGVSCNEKKRILFKSGEAMVFPLGKRETEDYVLVIPVADEESPLLCTVADGEPMCDVLNGVIRGRPLIHNGTVYLLNENAQGTRILWKTLSNDHLPEGLNVAVVPSYMPSQQPFNVVIWSADSVKLWLLRYPPGFCVSLYDPDQYWRCNIEPIPLWKSNNPEDGYTVYFPDDVDPSGLPSGGYLFRALSDGKEAFINIILGE